MNVMFRVDSSVQIGSGHVMRCLVLAKQMSTLGVNVSFVCRPLEGNLNDFISNQGYRVFQLTAKSQDVFSDLEWYQHHWKKDANETLNVITQQNILIDLLIVDHYGLDGKWETLFGEKVKKLMVIDDLANRIHQCHILLDQNYVLNLEHRYNHLVSANTRLLLGPKFLLLREEFMKINKRSVRNGKIKEILVFFGGSDPTHETIKTIEALTDLNLSKVTINVVVGSSNSRKTWIESYCKMHHNFYFYCQIPYMAQLMNKADLFIGAGGTTTWERCYLGLPSLTIIIADNQVDITEAVAAYGGTINLGRSDEVTREKIMYYVKYLMENPEKLKEMSNRSADLVSSEIIHSKPVIDAVMEELM